VESEDSFEAVRSSPVSYMLPRNRASKSRKFFAHSSLLIADESPLSHPPGYSVSYSPSCLEGNPEDCPAGHSERNLESYLVCCSVSYLTGYPERNSESCLGSRGGRYPASSSPRCPENRSGSNPESNLLSNGADNPLGYSESNPADSSASCSDDSGRHTKVCPHRCGQPRRDMSVFGVRERSSRFPRKTAASEGHDRNPPEISDRVPSRDLLGQHNLPNRLWFAA